MSVTAFSWRRDPEWKSCEWRPQRDDDHSGMELTVPGEQLKWKETEMTLFWSISTQSQYTFSVSGYPIFLWHLEENLLRLYMKKNYGKQHIILNSETFQLSLWSSLCEGRQECLLSWFLFNNSLETWVKKRNKRYKAWDFPGGPVSKTLSSQCRGPRFDPWSRN